MTGSSTFSLCSSLSRIFLKSGMTFLGSNMFQMLDTSQLTTVTIPSTITAMGNILIYYNILSQKCIYNNITNV